MTGIPDPGGVSGTFAALERTQSYRECIGSSQMFVYADTHHVRVIRDIDGEPLVVLADLCRALEIRNGRDVAARLGDDQKGVAAIDTPGGPQNMTVVNESGLYEVIIRSDKPEAVKFRRWITGEVLPALRRSGSYSTTPALTEDQIVHQALSITARRVEELTAKVAELEPKAEFYDHLMDADGCYSMQATANVLGWGRNVMMAELRKLGVLQGNRLPFRRYAHHFKVVPQTYTNADGLEIPTATTYVLPSGIEFLRKKLAGVMV